MEYHHVPRPVFDFSAEMTFLLDSPGAERVRMNVKEWIAYHCQQLRWYKRRLADIEAHHPEILGRETDEETPTPIIVNRNSLDDPAPRLL